MLKQEFTQDPSKDYLSPIANLVYDSSLGMNIRFGEGAEIIDGIADPIKAMLEVELERSTVSDSAELRIVQYSSARVVGCLAVHNNMLRQYGKIILPLDDQNFEWVSVSTEASTSQASTNINDVNVDETANIPWIDALNEQADEDVLQKAARTTTLKVDRLSESLSDLLPKIEIVKVLNSGSRLPWRRNILITDDALTTEQYVEELKNLPGKTLRVAHELKNLLHNLLLDPGSVLGREITSIYTAEIDEVLKQITNMTVAAIHHGTIDTTSQTSSRAEKKAAYRSRKLENETNTFLVLPEIQSDRDTLIVESDELIEIGQHGFDFPWLGDTEHQLPVKKLEGKKHDIYIVYAEANGLKEIADRVKRDTGVNAKGQTKYEVAAEQQARRMSEGIMPFQSANSVKRLRMDNNDLKPDYQTLGACWYTFDISPNAPRIYFTLNECPEMIAGEKPKANSKLMVIFAETDKANQMAVFRKLTTKSQSSLKQKGVGSI